MCIFLAEYQKDYITKDLMTFATVFAILFSSVTGILNGANMSGQYSNGDTSHAWIQKKISVW